MTSRGWRRHGTKGRCRTGGATHPSSRSAFTAFAAAAAWSRRPGWCKARTVMSSQSDRASMPSSSACAYDVRVPPTQLRCCRAQCRAVELTGSREDRVSVGPRDRHAYRRGSLQSHTRPRAQRSISSCSITTLGTGNTSLFSTRPRARSAAVAASAARANHHASTLAA
eukprot:1582874-Pleurochrysis_carterae.AAC.3